MFEKLKFYKKKITVEQGYKEGDRFCNFKSRITINFDSQNNFHYNNVRLYMPDNLLL